MDHPTVKEEPEAIYTIMKYNLLKNFGSAYTWGSLDNETFENIQLMSLCMGYENKALENAQSKAQFTQENMK